MSAPQDQSPFERRAYAYIERGYSVIPIAPGSKRPGQWSQAKGWCGMHDWERFATRQPTEIELDHWYKWPNAGIGLLTGKLSGVVALDRDYDANGTEALERLIPFTPVKKKGAKGYTAFFKFNGERSCSYNIGGMRVLDVLADGRQTLMPGTVHPDGHTYIYLTEDLLEDYDPADLPQLPDDFLEQVARTLAPYQTVEDKKYAAKTVKVKDSDQPINTDLSIQAEYFRDVNRQALTRLAEWVPKIVPLSKVERDGYRTVASWRGAKNHNVGIHPSGIFDFGGNYGMTPIDLVMYANGLPFIKAAESLRACLAFNEPAPLQMTVGGVKNQTPPPELGVMPWQKKPAVLTAPPVLMLPPQTSFDPAPAVPAFIQNPPGILGDISRWITATAPKSQPELSVAAAIALASVVMARTYRSQFGNFSSLYFILVAKSTEGKEHPQQCVEKLLTQAELSSLIGGSGYTSAGAVYSALLKSPAHIVTIDEIGKMLKMSRAKGNAHSEAAIDKLVEAFGRTDGVLRPPTYSTMTLKDSAKPAERIVHNPGITMLGATTPGTFYSALTTDLVKDGFLGRCIVVESKQPRQLTRFVDRTDAPEQIVKWCQAVHASGAGQGNLVDICPAEMPAKTIELQFSESCRPIMDAFELELNDEKNASEGEGLDVLLGRTLEKAMKLAMVACKADKATNKQVLPVHLEWAIQYVRHYDTALVRSVRKYRFENETDGNIKKIIEIVGQAKRYALEPKLVAKYAMLAHGAMPHALLLRYMHMSAAELTKLTETAVEAGLLTKEWGHSYNYAGQIYQTIETN